MKIDILGRGSAWAELDERIPGIAQAIWQTLPLEARANIWGEEVYFEMPLQLQDEKPSPTAAPGDISYWAPGSALCIFFGQTKPYSPVNHVGKIREGLHLFKDVLAGDRIVLNRK